MKAPRQRLRPILLFLSALALLAITGCQQQGLVYPAAYHESAYVTNGKSNDVSVIDMRSFKTVKTIPVGKSPTGVAASPTRNEVYVVDSESNDLKVIDAEQNVVTATIALGHSPFFVDVSADGNRAYVANSGSNDVSVVDLVARKVIATVSVGKTPGLAKVSPDGKTVVVSNRGDDSVSIVDAKKVAVRATIPICSQPTDIAIVVESNKAFVACATRAAGVTAAKKGKKQTPTLADDGPGQVAVVDLVSDKLLTLLDVGKTPVHLALKPDGGELFVSNFGSDNVSTIETGANEVASAQPMGGNPVRSVVSADNSLLYVSNFGSGSVGVYSIQNGKFLKSIAVGSQPDAIALQPAINGKQYFLLVADSKSNDVAVIFANPDKPAWSLFTMIPVGIEPRQIAVKAFTSTQKR
jgi:YVTN family beta-propeller protein